jgi:hypothetical protein
LRLVVVRLDEQRCHLIYTNHHILMDGWSNSQLLGEVLQRYSGVAQPPLAGRYRDYIEWLQRQDVQASERYWTAQLADCKRRPCSRKRWRSAAMHRVTVMANIACSTLSRRGVWASSRASRRSPSTRWCRRPGCCCCSATPARVRGVRRHRGRASG